MTDGTLFGLLFMTMGPIRAVSVFASFGDSDAAPGVRELAGRAVGLVAIAFAIAVVMGDQALARWGVGLPALITAAGLILTLLSLHAMITPAVAASRPSNVDEVSPAQIAFPGLFPPIAVALPIIFAASGPSLANKATILAIGLLVLAINWLAMRHAKAILGAIGPTTLQLLGAVFGVLQTALGIEFIIDAHRMM